MRRAQFFSGRTHDKKRLGLLFAKLLGELGEILAPGETGVLCILEFQTLDGEDDGGWEAIPDDKGRGVKGNVREKTKTFVDNNNENENDNDYDNDNDNCNDTDNDNDNDSNNENDNGNDT